MSAELHVCGESLDEWLGPPKQLMRKKLCESCKNGLKEEEKHVKQVRKIKRNKYRCWYCGERATHTAVLYLLYYRRYDGWEAL